MHAALEPVEDSWRLCPSCPHMRRELATAAPSPSCPRCGDPDWSDAGRLRSLVHFRRARSLTTRAEAQAVDDSEERQQESYGTLDLIDASQDNWGGARAIVDVPFGFELLRNLKLRELNCGVAGAKSASSFQVAGKAADEGGFEVCLDCGRVRDHTRGRAQGIQHAAHCRARRPGAKEDTGTVYLYREIESEAIRILLPVAEMLLEEKRASFKAALDLGFRRHFQGDPGHLQIKSMSEPLKGRAGYRQYLVVFDAVPGGTGYLSELWHGDNFLGILERALGAMSTCVCQLREQPGDGCYRCLFAYQRQRELPLISSRLARKLLGDILAKRSELKPLPTLSDVPLELRLESELEAKFLDALARRLEPAEEDGLEQTLHEGEVRWTLRLGAVRWEVRTQVDVGLKQGVAIACRPDFVLRRVGVEAPLPEVAVFCDGFAYHGCPGQSEGRTGDDISKRTALIASEHYVVWSVTWKDVEDFLAGPKRMTARSILEKTSSAALGKLSTSLGVTLDVNLSRRGSMEGLLAYLRDPGISRWAELARCSAVAWIVSGPRMAGAAADLLESCLLEEATRHTPGPELTPQADELVLSHADSGEFFTALARVPAATLSGGTLADLRVTLRLFDAAGDRSAPAFEADWRSFLHAWNLLQFDPGTRVVSSEFLSQGYGAVEAALPRAAEPVPGFHVLPGVRELLELATAATRSLILEVADGGLPLPVQDHELAGAPGRIGAVADLAWPAARVAVLTGTQSEDRDRFVAAGFTVFVEAFMDAEVIAALRSRIGPLRSDEDEER